MQTTVVWSQVVPGEAAVLEMALSTLQNPGWSPHCKSTQMLPPALRFNCLASGQKYWEWPPGNMSIT